MSSQLPRLRKIIMEKYIYSVVGLEASNFVPEISVEGTRNTFPLPRTWMYNVSLPERKILSRQV